MGVKQNPRDRICENVEMAQGQKKSGKSEGSGLGKIVSYWNWKLEVLRKSK